MGLRAVLMLAVAAALVLGALITADARYLPTRRSQDDRLDRLRELLKDLLESEDHSEYDRRLFYKREMQPPLSIEQLYRQN
uniref:Proctolin n=1 Tax=Laodelphax striatellus TaxID=195883 RepID=A0A345BEE9_LAOST|nr:proctolin [Laodelphax striatellus]